MEKGRDGSLSTLAWRVRKTSRMTIEHLPSNEMSIRMSIGKSMSSVEVDDPWFKSRCDFQNAKPGNKRGLGGLERQQR